MNLFTKLIVVAGFVIIRSVQELCFLVLNYKTYAKNFYPQILSILMLLFFILLSLVVFFFGSSK